MTTGNWQRQHATMRTGDKSTDKLLIYLLTLILLRVNPSSRQERAGLYPGQFTSQYQQQQWHLVTHLTFKKKKKKHLTTDQRFCFFLFIVFILSHSFFLYVLFMQLLWSRDDRCYCRLSVIYTTIRRFKWPLSESWNRHKTSRNLNASQQLGPWTVSHLAVHVYFQTFSRSSWFIKSVLEPNSRNVSESCEVPAVNIDLKCQLILSTGFRFVYLGWLFCI